MITIIDYGVGNVKSVENMLKKCGLASMVTNDTKTIRNSERLILPGVGAFDTAMRKLIELSLVEIIQDAAKRKIPILGICLGAQLLFDRSEEGDLNGLGIIPGICRKFNSTDIAPLRVPHMGWSDVCFNNAGTIPFNNLKEVSPRFYFVHSYYFNCADKTNVLATTDYGHNFECAVIKENVIGVQFHPEKSHKFGEMIFQSFASLPTN